MSPKWIQHNKGLNQAESCYFPNECISVGVLGTNSQKKNDYIHVSKSMLTKRYSHMVMVYQ